MWWRIDDDGDDSPRLKVWHVLFVLTPLILWLAWSTYQDFSRLEEHGGTMQMHGFTKTLYILGGKWAVVAVPVAVIALWLYAVVVTLRLHRRADELAGLREPPPPPAPPPPELPRAVVTSGAPSTPRLDPLAGKAPTATPTTAPTGDGPSLLR